MVMVLILCAAGAVVALLYRVGQQANQQIVEVRLEAKRNYEATKAILLDWFPDQDNPTLRASAREALRLHDTRVRNAALFLPNPSQCPPLEWEYLAAYTELLRDDEQGIRPGNASRIRQHEAMEFAEARAACRSLSD